jgi:heme-degrading monooxygenase HmoA
MGKYCLVRVWQLKAGCRGEELEELVSSGYVEIQRWIPGVEHVSLLRGGGEGRYVLTTTFASYEAYKYWRQVEEEGADYWERYAAIVMQWERTCHLLAEYAGEVVVDMHVEGAN